MEAERQFILGTIGDIKLGNIVEKLNGKSRKFQGH